MTKETQIALGELIKKFVVTNPEFHPRPLLDYIKDISIALINVPDNIILETVAMCYDKEFWKSKGVMYIKGIALGKQKEYKKRKEIEEQTLTPIPKIKW